MRFQLSILSVLVPVLTGSTVRAQNGRPAPTGTEIAAKAKATRFDRSNIARGTFQGQTMTLTPAVLRGSVSSIEDMKNGQIIGLMETGAIGDETGLPPGRYNLFVAYVDGRWRGYAEADGRIVSEAIRTSLTTPSGAPKTLQFKEQGWCFFVPAWVLGFPLPSEYGWWVCF